MFAGSNAAVPAGASGSPMSLAASTSWASEASAWPSWPPNMVPPSDCTIAAIGPIWSRICSGSMSLIALTICPATGSQSVRHTSSVVAEDRVTVGELVLGDLPGQIPVHRARVGRAEHLLQLGDELRHLLRIARVRYATGQPEAERHVSHP